MHRCFPLALAGTFVALLCACPPPTESCVYGGVTHAPDTEFRGEGCEFCRCTTGGRYACEPGTCASDGGLATDAALPDREVSDAAADGSVPDGSAATDAGRHDAAWGSEAGALPTCTALLVERVSTATVINPPGTALPAVGAPFEVGTGLVLRRLTDSADSDGFSSGYTNGYSRFSPANVTGEYVTAFASNGAAAIYRLSDRSVVRTLTIGESNELHWDASGAPGSATTLFYRQGAQLRRLDILDGRDALVHDFTQEYAGASVAINGVEGAPSRDMRYWAFMICDGMSGGGQCTGMRDVIVYDKVADSVLSRLRDGYADAPIPNFVDISPSGSRIIVGSCAGNPAPFNGMYAWNLDFTGPVRLSTGCTHSGWAYGRGGEEFFVSQDPCGANNDEITRSCDFITAVDVNDADGWVNRVPVLGLGDLGWGNGIHIGRIYDDRVRGWFFLSTYSDSTQNWGTNQLLFVELIEHSLDPGLWRVTPTLNAFQGYWSEAFASLDFAAGHAYWGANWNGASELQLYEAQLCDQWWLTLPNNGN